MDKVAGLILAGGAGRRMGGADKGLFDYRGRPLVAWAIERFAPQVDALTLCANRNLDTYRAFGYPVVSDTLADFQGPLAGLLAGLEACPAPWLALCPCDCPALPADLVARLLAAAQASGASLAVARADGKLQPTFQLCHTENLPALRDFLASGNRKLGLWCRERQAVEVDFPAPEAFANLNYQADIANGP